MTSIAPIVRLLATQGSSPKEALVLEFNGKQYHVYCGIMDEIHVFTEGVCIYVLTINRLLGRLGLCAYMATESGEINTVFLHSPEAIRETLGAEWEILSPEAIAKRLIDYLI